MRHIANHIKLLLKLEYFYLPLILGLDPGIHVFCILNNKKILLQEPVFNEKFIKKEWIPVSEHEDEER